MGQRRCVVVVTAALFVAACGSSAVDHAAPRSGSTAATGTYAPGPPDSAYWIAGWLPKTEQLDSVRSAGNGSGALRSSATVEYASRGLAEPDVSIEALKYAGAPPLSRCDDKRLVIPTYRSTTRGHQSCEGPDSDEGKQFGWIVSWIERPGLRLTVRTQNVYEDVARARPIAQHIAADVRPVTAGAWNGLVTMTEFAFGPQARPDMKPVVVLHGNTKAGRWTLTALLPHDYPLGPDDHRWPCARIDLQGQTRTVCAEDAGRGSRFTRVAGHVFAFGVLPAHARTVELRDADQNGTPASNVVVANLRTVPALPVRDRFYAAELPADNCGVVVFDVTTRPPKNVSEVLSLPSDGPPCDQAQIGPAQTIPPGIAVRPTVPARP